MMYCNACGKKLKMQHDVLLEDAFEAKKECYDRITAQFVIPPDVSEVTEL